MKFIKTLVKKQQKSNRFPVEKYRAVLLDVSAEENPEGLINITFSYSLIRHRNSENFEFDETFVDNINLVRSLEFFQFLETSHIEFDNYEELIGMVFDTVLNYEFIGGQEVPVLTKKELVAHPPKYPV